MSLFAASDRAWFLTGGVGTNCADQCASVGGRPREVALQAAEGIRSVLNGKLPGICTGVCKRAATTLHGRARSDEPTRVLVVDDEFIRAALRLIFLGAGFTTEILASASEGPKWAPPTSHNL